MTLHLPPRIETNIAHFTGRTWLLPKVVAWLEQSDQRLLLLTGQPGTGKSMLVAWLAGAGPPPADPEARARLDHVRARLKAVHFCVAASGSIAPKALAENLAQQLTRTVAGFGEALTATLSARVSIVVEQRIERVEGGRVTGVHINQLNLGGLSDEESFDRTLRDPLTKVYAGGYDQPMLLLIDALDEAATYTGPITIVRLLARLTDLPQPVRIVVTTRPDPRVRKHYRGVPSIDLIKDAPPDVDDVRRYAATRLTGLDDQRRERFASRIAQAAEGNFLYAHLVLNDLLPDLPSGPELEAIAFPQGLSGLCHEFLTRELGADEDRWYGQFKPVLGLMAVAQGDGLTRNQLEAILDQEVEAVLRKCSQYLDGALPDGPFRPFHRSFAEFLLEDQENTDYHIDATRMHGQIADYYWKTYSSDWHRCDRYGLNSLATHLLESGQTGRLLALISEEWMHSRYRGSAYTYTDFLADVDLAWRAALAGGRVDPVALVRLHMARQAVSEQVSVYTDTDLETLVWLGRANEALAHARLRHELGRKLLALFTVYSALKQRDQLNSSLLNEVYDIACGLQDDSLRAAALSDLAGALAQVGRFNEAKAVAYSIQDDSLRAAALSDLAGALAQVGRFEAAEVVARSIQGDGWRARALWELASVLARAGDSRASGVFEEAEVLTRSIQDDLPRTWALSDLALAQVGRFKEAEAVARSIQGDRLRARALSELAGALARAGDSRAGDVFEAAEAVAHSLQDDSLRAEALHALAGALAQGGRFEAAEAVARSIPDEQGRAAALRELAGALAQVDRFEAAEVVARSIPDEQGRAAALSDLAGALAQGGRFEAAEAVARSILDDGSRVGALWELASVLARAGDSRAGRIFDEVEAVARSIPNNEGRAEALSELAGALIQVGRFGQAEAVARSLQDDSLRARALREFAEALLQASRFGQAEAVARSIQADSLRAEALHTLAGALAQAGRFEAAEAVACSIPDEQGRAAALRELAGALARVGDDRASGVFEAAEAVARSLPYDWERAEALHTLAGALAQAGRFEAAEAVARSLQDDSLRARALRELAGALARVGDDRASGVFEAAEAVARSLPDDQQRAWALRELARALAQGGRFGQAEAVARSIPDEQGRAAALRELAGALARVGDDRASGVFEAAEAVARSIQNDWGRASALRELADALAQAGRFDEALLTLSPRSLDESLQAMANWAPSFEEIAPGSSLAVLREATRVAGWVRPDWRRVSELLSSE
ncbi:MAG: hypothetical protein M5U01_26175 [Ardenticatenaceae bacterium]|nr:hypothetical protein [Ardenticatenaceae bacterium]